MTICQWAIADTVQGFTIDSSLESQLGNLFESFLPYLCRQYLLFTCLVAYLSIIFSSSKFVLGVVPLLLDYNKPRHILKSRSAPVGLDYTGIFGS